MTGVMGIALTDISKGSRMAADDRLSIQTEHPTVFPVGVMELGVVAIILAPILLLIGLLLFLIARRKKP